MSDAPSDPAPAPAAAPEAPATEAAQPPAKTPDTAAEPATSTEPKATETTGNGAHGEDDGGEQDHSPNFAPVVELSEVETKTGEEDELVVFKIRSKLFRFDKSMSEWKERGTGDVRLLQHKESKKVRLLMRRERTLKVCLNHYVNASVELRENVGSDKSWVFHAIDYADGERDEAMLAIRFANSENANLFKDAYENACLYMKALLAGEELPELKIQETDADVDNEKEAKTDKTNGESAPPGEAKPADVSA